MRENLSEARNAMEWGNLLAVRRERLSSRLGGELRSEFERDYDRAVFSTPVRRMQDKAQVFPLEPLDSVRTRLTHSLEVSTIARDVARAVARWLREKGCVKAEEADSIEAIGAACGLIHDLGNPPFGRAGEIAIQDWFQRNSKLLADLGGRQQWAQDFLRFQGNAQTLRLVARLQVLADQNGLNLTYGTLSAALKYTAQSDQIDKSRYESSKPGYFASENELVDTIRTVVGTGTARNPITYLVEASDDIAYLAVDLEDGVKKRVIDWGSLKDELTNAAAERDLVDAALTSAEAQIDRGTAKLKGADRDEAYAVALRIALIARTVPAAIEAFKQHYDLIMQGGLYQQLLDVSTGAPLVAACRTVGVERVYCSTGTQRLEVMARHVIHGLMKVFWEGVQDWPSQRSQEPQSRFGASVYGLFSPNYRAVFEDTMKEGKLPAQYCKLQLVTDYVAGMTDTFACTLHKQLMNG
jgi:dGTPase